MRLTQNAAGRWRLETFGELIGYDGENNAYQIRIAAEIEDAGSWDWYAEFEYADGSKGTMPLMLDASSVSADGAATFPASGEGTGVLTASMSMAYLLPGRAMMQLRAVSGETVKKTNPDMIVIEESINATDELEAPGASMWDEYAAQVAALRNQAAASAQEASAQAQRAEEAAERGPYIGEDGYWYVWDSVAGAYANSGQFSGGVDFTTDETLSLVDGVLRVNTADAVEQDNTLPITSAAVHTTVGNIEVLLGTI